MNSTHLPPMARRGGGMQVHAVPENERAIDPKTGQRLPWAYEYADPDRANQRRMPEERGPFGRSMNRRGASRSKTFTPVSKKEDKDAAENWRAIDDIFTRAKQESGNALATDASGAQSQQQASAAAAAAAVVPTTQNGTATEVILYGFAEAYQYAAIDFFERVSGGAIYEDYDRMPAHTRFDLTLSRGAGARGGKVPVDALRKVNRYHGGSHWIKVTFDSAEAAERACFYSPHTLNGYIVFAERYRGEGPARDEAMPATKERLASIQSSPSQAASSSTVKALSSGTASTATIQDIAVQNPQTPSRAPALASGAVTTSFSAQTPQHQQQLQQRQPKTPLIKGASRAVLLPAESALLPSSSRWQRLFGSWPILAVFFGSNSGQDMIGNELPRKEDGTFDWEHASLYWWFWALLDYYLWFANFLGLKGDE